MEVTTNLGTVTVVSVTGDIDAETFPQLIGEVSKALDTGQPI
jgi:anti-anti-sigma regulatory factor